MNKFINLYIFLILFIALFLIFNVDFNSAFTNSILYTPFLHELFEWLIIFIFILTFLKTNKLYSQTRDKRFAIIAGSFLAGSFFHLFDLFFLHNFSSDIGLKPSLIYALSEKLVIPFSIFIAVFYTEKSSERKPIQFRRIIYFLYLCIALLTVVLTQLIFPLLFKSTFLLFEQGLVIADESLYFLTALILADQRLISNKNIFSMFILGLIILGVSQLFYINSLLVPISGLISVFLKLVGYLFLFLGLKDFQLLPKTVKLRQKLLAYMAVLLIMSYLTFSLFISIILKIDLPANFPFIFLVFLLFSVAIEYIISAEFTSPIAKIIRVVNKYKPEEKSEKIPVKSTDEIGELSEQLNNIIEINWDYTQELKANEEKILKFLNKEQLSFTITNSIRSTLDLDEVLTIICEETLKLFKVQRAVISELADINHPENFIIRREFKLDKSIKGSFDAKKINEEYFKELGQFWVKNMIEPKKILAIDNISESDSSDLFKEAYSYMGVKSIIGIPITFCTNKLWALYLSEYDYYRHWTDEEKTMLENISSQICIAIKQADLFSTTKKQYEKEELLRTVVETIRTSLDINEVKRTIVNEIGKVFNADRCYFRTFNKKTNKFLLHDIEYLSSADISSLKIIEPDQEGLRLFYGSLLEKLEKETYPLLIDVDSVKIPLVKKYMQNAQILLDCAIPVWHSEDEFMFLVIHYTKKKPLLGAEDLNFLEMVAKQVKIAIDQSKLYEEQKQTAEREKLLRSINNDILENENIIKASADITNDIGKLFNVDRLNLRLFDSETKTFSEAYGEYKKDESLPSAIGKKIPQKEVNDFLVKALYEKKQTLVINVDDPNCHEFFKIGMEFFDAKSTVIIPIFYKDNLLAAIFVSNIYSEKKWSKEEKEFLILITQQVAIAINLFRINEAEKQKTEREKLLRSINNDILENENIIKASADITNDIGKLFNVDRINLRLFDSETKTFSEAYGEYKKDESLPTAIGKKIPQKEVNEFLVQELYEKKQTLVINVADPNCHEFFKIGMDFFDAKTTVIIPIFHKDNLIAAIFVTNIYSEKKWPKEELEFIILVTQQIAVGINLFKIVEEQKQKAEREVLLRKIIETIRSNFAINEIKTLFVNSIGNFFNADRVLFSEFNSQKNMYEPVDPYSEYLSSQKEMSFIGYDWSNPEISEYIQPLIQKQEINIYNLDEYLEQNPKSPAFVSLFKDANVQSSYNMPVLYLNEIVGYFCIEFTQREYRLTEEERDFIRSIINQVGIALNQVKLFNFVHQLANRENLFKKIIETSGRTLNINEAKNIIVNKIGRFLNADIFCIRLFDSSKDEFLLLDEYSEYIDFSETKSLRKIEDENGYIKELFKKDKPVYISDTNALLTENKEVSDTLKAFIEINGIKSIYTTPIYYSGQLFGAFGLFYTKKSVKLSDDTLDFIRALAHQTAVILFSKIQNSSG